MKFKSLFGYLFVALISMAVLTGCGNGGDEASVASDTKKPGIVTIIGLTSIDSDKIMVEWLEANDDTTSIQNMKYEIHVSKDKKFTPNSLTLRKSLKGIDFTTIEGLDKDTEYFIKIVAIDKDNLKSIGFEDSIKTSSIKVTVAPETKYLKTTKHVSSNTIIVDDNSTLKNNDIIVSEENGGFARRITKVIDKNGKKTLETTSISLAEIYKNMKVQTSVRLVDLENSKNQKLSKTHYKTLQKNGFQLSRKWQSGLTIFDTKVTNHKKYKITQSQIQKAEPKIKTQSIEEESFKLTIPEYYAFDIEDKDSQKIFLKFLLKKEPEFFGEDYWYEVCSVSSQMIIEDGIFYNGKVKQEQDTIFSIDYSHNYTLKNHIGEKQDIKFQITTAKRGTCKNKKPTAKDTYTVKSKVYIGSGSLTLSGKIGTQIKFSGYKGKNLNVTSTLTGTYEPQLLIDSFIKDGKLVSGKVEVVAKINLKNEIKAALEATKNFEYKKTFIEKKFVKVIQAGPIPLVFNGSFEVALVIEGAATGKIDITNTLIHDYELHAGFQYNKDTEQWKYIGKAENKFEIKLKGEAGAEVLLKVSLQPKFTVKLYDSVGGGVALDPYVKAEASGKMVHSISENIDISTMTGIRTQFVNDAFISVDKVDASLGLDLKWYVIASVFDYRLKAYPKNVDEDKASTYAKVTVIKPQLFASLPILSIEYKNYLSEIGKDSRWMIVEGKAKLVKSKIKESFNLGSTYLINHRKWSFTELIRPRQEMLNPIDENQFLVLIDTVSADYKIRMLEESTLGLPHVVESTFKAEDSNYNNLPDSWEKAYGIYESGNTENSGLKDSDKDGLSNADEFRYGTHPDKQDSDADGCTDKEEIDAQTKPLDKYSRPKNCKSDDPEPEQPNPTVTLSLGNDFLIEEGKSKVIPFTITDTAKQIKSVTCFTTPSISVFSNTNKKVSFTAPSWASVKAFTIRCQAKDATKVLASSSVKVTVTKKSEPQPTPIPTPQPEPQNEAPTVTLPSQTLLMNQENTVTPTTTDDKGITSYVWNVSWSGKQGTVVSALNASSLKLNIPNLEPGESGSATVSITVKDEEGLSDTATKTYSYSVEKEEALQFVSDNFTDGETLAPSSSKPLEWKIKNVSNVDLKNVVVNLTQEATALNVEEITPKTIALWEKGETKTFTTTLSVPYNVTAGTHKQVWNFSYDGGKALPYEGQTSSASIFFEFKTTDPQELVGRLITDKKLIKPNETITSLLEITSGNEPYSIEVNWGDGNNESFSDVSKNNTNSMTKSLTHTYANEGSYNIEVKVTDSANKQATFTDTIKVETNTITTSWTADAHDIVTDAKESNINIAVNNTEYRTSWSEPSGSTEYFVKYRLPVPSNLLKLDRKVRVTVRGIASNIVGYDREINFRTSSALEYTASIRDANFEETLDDGAKIKGGYFTIKNLSTGAITKEEASTLNTNSVEDGGLYSMEINPEFEVISVAKDATHYELLSKDINLNQQSWLSELDITFKGNGIIQSILLEYDKDGNGEFSADEKLVLNTVDKVVDWGKFGEEEEIPSESNMTFLDDGITAYKMTQIEGNATLYYDNNNLVVIEGSFKGRNNTDGTKSEVVFCKVLFTPKNKYIGICPNEEEIGYITYGSDNGEFPNGGGGASGNVSYSKNSDILRGRYTGGFGNIIEFSIKNEIQTNLKKLY